jgi:hypothetical protein
VVVNVGDALGQQRAHGQLLDLAGLLFRCVNKGAAVSYNKFEVTFADPAPGKTLQDGTNPLLYSATISTLRCT